MRLDHFLPFRKRKGGKEQGAARKVLARIGRSWLQSPARRVVQGICFVAFLVSFLHVLWPYSAEPVAGAEVPSHYTDDLSEKEFGEAEAFLSIDPLVGLSTALAGRLWLRSLLWAGGILVVCFVVPRGFCGYICPLGTLIDLFDWAVGRRITRWRLGVADGGWVHLKYYVLAGTLAASAGGVLVSGYVAAIPVLTRGLLFSVSPVQLGLDRGWHQVPAPHAGEALSLFLFAGVLLLGLLRPRFWCRYVCPSGAIFSISNLFRTTERKVDETCISCNKCVEVCPFDAIGPGYGTRTAECTFCQTCGGACPTHSIQFVDRWANVAREEKGDGPTARLPVTRRGLLTGALGGLGLALGVGRAFGGDHAPPVRPPGSVPEKEFLRLCIRCGECFQACPNRVLQPMGFEQGLDGLWTPRVVADWSGCEPSCNRCGQVCPTGAIRPLPIEEKRVARMGLAIVDRETCLPWALREDCQLCVDECKAAGYDAIEFEHVGTEVDEDGMPIAGTGHDAPVVRPELCVGCGLCQTRCVAINVRARGLLDRTAILVEAGSDREDRILSGSYLDLRQRELEERRRREEERMKKELETIEGDDFY